MLEANLANFAGLLPGLQATVLSPEPWSPEEGSVDTLPSLRFPLLGQATDAEQRALLAQILAAARSGEYAGLGSRAAAVAQVVAALGEADGLIVSGGGNLHARWPEHLYERVALAELAHGLGKPVAFLGQTLGPEVTDVQADVLGAALRRAAWVGVRDLPSASLALSLGTPAERLDYQLDDAFFLAPRAPSEEVQRSLHGSDNEPWIAVTVHPFAAQGDAVFTSVAGQLRELAAATGARLVFLPHQATREAGGTDGELSRALAAMVGPLMPSAVLPVLPARVVRWLTGRASLVISTRYHPLVFALAAGIPCLAVAATDYGRVKAQGALRHGGQSASYLRLAEAADGALLPRALDLWRRREALRTELEAQRRGWEEQESGRWRRLLVALRLGGEPEPSDGTATATLLGHDARRLAIDLAATLEAERRAAGEELARRQAELRWVTGTLTWRLRSRLVRLRWVVRAYRALRTLRP
jgi:polysaccharide pyruvyl transferase WcaK-like protein